MDDVPAQTVEAVLAGMAARGVDVAVIRARADLPPGPAALETLWPSSVFGIAWQQALQQFPNPTIPAEVGLLVPFGAIGMIDYLAGSSESIGGALHALVAHFPSVAAHPTITLVEAVGEVRFEVHVGTMPLAWIAEEFTLAMALKSLRHVAAEALPLIEVCMTRSDPAPGALAAVLDAPVRFDCPIGALRFRSEVLSLPLRTADPQLHRAMVLLAASMGLGETRDPLDQAIRARLRDLLPVGEAGAAAMARALGMSERTLHRRLQERGTTWRAVTDAFRCDESKRLLRAGSRPMADIALAVGFSEQSTWTRAFRRWMGKTPGQWARDSAGRSDG